MCSTGTTTYEEYLKYLREHTPEFENLRNALTINVTEFLYFDHKVCYLLGIDQAKFTGTAEDFFNVVHPDDREMLKSALARTIEQDMPYETEYRASGRMEASITSLPVQNCSAMKQAGR